MSPEAKKEKPGDVAIAEFDPNEIDALHDLYMWNWANNYVFVRTIRPDVGSKESERVFVAKKGGKMVGAIFYRPQEDSAYLLNLVVKIDCRGQGVAQELIEFATDQANRDGFSKTVLKARNDQLVGFYQGLGFVLTDGFDRTLAKDIGTK